MIYTREGSWQRNCDLKVGQRSHSVRAKIPSPKQIGAMTLSKDWVNCDLNLIEEVQHYKQMSVVKSLSEVRWTLPQTWLQKKSSNTQKVMMTKKPSLPKNWRVTSKDSYKNETNRKSKGTFDLGLGTLDFDFGMETILLEREREREREDPPLERERETRGLRERVIELWD